MKGSLVAIGEGGVFSSFRVDWCISYHVISLEDIELN